MNRIYSVTASAVVILWSLPQAQGAPKQKAQSPSTAAQIIFERIDAQSATIADTAFRLGEMAKSQRDRQSHLEGLAALRTDVNHIGAEIQSLEAERSSLSEWEGQALGQILPIMVDVADNAGKALKTFASDQGRLWASSYVNDTARISKDAEEVAALLRDYLKLAKDREKELQLEQSLSQASGF